MTLAIRRVIPLIKKGIYMAENMKGGDDIWWLAP